MSSTLPVKLAVGALVVLPVLFGATFGCGNARPGPAGDNAFVPPAGGGTGGGGGPFQDAGAQKPPGCGQKDDGSFCDCVDVPLFADPPNLYFVLDRSGSMQDQNKWSQVRVVVSKILKGLGPRASFGATMYPGLDVRDSCAPPIEVMPIRPGDPPGAGEGPTTKALLDATAVTPYGGTPTAAALQFVLPKLRLASGKTFVILATDGGPNCGTTACGYDKCQLNIENIPGCPSVGPKNCCEPPEGSYQSCLDANATAAAVSALRTAGIDTYVVGIPGSATYANLLDQLATAGGTALSGSPKYYRIDNASEDAILATLKKVAAKIVATCEIVLKDAPPSAELVNVYLDEVVLPQDPVDGWKIEGKTVTLLGAACDKVLAGDVLDVRIIAGCPTVGPR